MNQHLADGRCTHEDVRLLLWSALRDPDLRETVGSLIGARTRAIVVDEIFDGDVVDFAILTAAAEAGVDVSVVGDPWQAVYQFRGANPWRSQEMLLNAGFTEMNIKDSFRFSPAVEPLMDDLRQGRGIALEEATPLDCDIVLATTWDMLWDHAPGIVPHSMGMVRNQWDAALLVLLDVVVDRRFGRSVVYGEDAYRRLAGESMTPADIRVTAEAWLDQVDRSSPPEHLMEEWRTDLRDAGVTAQLRMPRGDKRDYPGRLAQIIEMLTLHMAVLGTTVHQAKGGEWARVGLLLMDDEFRRIASGLDRQEEADRVLYVAATRAKAGLWHLPT
jgi:DNA helicase-2/ATP-dependent DNA helicase PcrA